MSGLLGLVLGLLRELVDEDAEWFICDKCYKDDIIENATPIQIFASVLGYLLVVRTNMALSRWMEAISNVEEMLSKWGDAFKALSGFFAGKKDTEERLRRILLFRARVAHWFSLMAVLAFATLRGGRIDKLDDVPIKVMLHPDEPDAKPALKKKMSFAISRKSQVHDQQFNEAFSTPAGPLTSSQSGMRISQTSRSAQSKILDPVGDQERLKLIGEMDLCVLSSPTLDEVYALDHATDKVNIISLWIIQGICIEVRAKTLDTPPPIVTRILQEVSNGMLAFNQAYKVAMTPFPFPFAQMVSLLLVLMDLLLPFYVDAFSQNPVVTPVICFLLTLCYHGLNNTAIELEEPFGIDWNDVDIENRNEAYQNMLIDTLRMPTTPPYLEEWPKYDSTKFERSIRRAITRSVEFLAERHPESKWPWDIIHLNTRPKEPVEEDKEPIEEPVQPEPPNVVEEVALSEAPPSWAEESNQEETNGFDFNKRGDPGINGLSPFASCDSPPVDWCTTEHRHMVVGEGPWAEAEAGHDRKIPSRLPPPA